MWNRGPRAGFNRTALIGNRPPRGLPPGATVYEVDTSEASAARRLHLGFYEPTIAAGAQVTVPAAPQVIFRPERIIIPSTIAGAVSINNIIIGNRSQLASANQFPGQSLSEVAIGTGMLLDTSQPGVDIQLIVTNISASPIVFEATMIGAVVASAP